MWFFKRTGLDKLAVISRNQIWINQFNGLTKKSIWFPKSGYGLSHETVYYREIDIESEGTNELKLFLADFFKEISKNVVAKMETWPNEAQFDNQQYFLPQDATIDLGSYGQNKKTLKLFGFLGNKSETQAIHFSKVEKQENGSLAKSLVSVVNLNLLLDENAWLIMNQISPKDDKFNVCLFLTMIFENGASYPSKLYLHLPRNYQEIRQYLDKVGL
jgi:hypothetical protein